MAHIGQYTKDYFFNDTGNFYIHRHHYCIGAANQGVEVTDESLEQFFASQRGAALTTSKNLYMKSFLSHLNMSQSEFDILNEAFNFDTYNLIKEIEEAGKAQLNQMMDRVLIKRGMDINQDIASVAPLLLNQDAKKSLKAYNNILDSLSQAINLIKDPELSETLAMLLLNQKRVRSLSLSNMGEKLGKALASFEKKHAKKLIEAKHENINIVLSAMKTMANTLETGKTQAKKNTLTKKNIVDVFDAMFNPNFMEVIASQCQRIGNNMIAQSIKPTGKEPYYAYVTGPDGSELKDFVTTHSRGKADSTHKHHKMQVTVQGTNQTFEIDMDFGISLKAYRTSEFSFTGDGSLNDKFHSGSGGSLKEAVYSLFSTDKDKYLAYNALAHWNNLPKATGALNDLILARQIGRLFAFRGKEELAPFIFFNGEIVSMTQIFDYITNNILYKSSSLVDSESTQAVSLSIKGRPQLKEAVETSKNAKTRVPLVNKIIGSTSISAYVHISKLMAGLESLK